MALLTRGRLRFRRGRQAGSPTPSHVDDRMTLLEHLEALRRVLIVSAGAWLLATLVAYTVHGQVLSFLVDRAGLPGDNAYYTSLTTPILIGLKVALYLGIVIASPVVFYQLWSFVSPGLHLHERRLVLPIVISSTIFFLVGVGFALFALPLFTKVLMSFATPQMRPLIGIDDLFGFVIAIVLAFGLVFELPVVIYVLGQLGVITSRWLYRTRIYWLIGLAVTASILTPGADPLTPMILFVPLLIFWEGTALLLKLTGK